MECLGLSVCGGGCDSFPANKIEIRRQAIYDISQLENAIEFEQVKRMV